MYAEDELLPISALQHLVFCERQWGLIYLEGLWRENLLTAGGGLLHDRVDRPGVEPRSGRRMAYGLALRSRRLGLIGRADLVEFPSARDGPDEGLEVPDWLSGNPVEAEPAGPYPVEFKHGRSKTDDCDRVQLCAQALCLEEMLDLEVPAGAVFYGQTRRREEVLFGPELRQKTEAAAKRLHHLTAAGKTPPPNKGRWCKSCSLVGECLPRAVAGRSAQAYLASALAASLAGKEPDP